MSSTSTASSRNRLPAELRAGEGFHDTHDQELHESEDATSHGGEGN